MGSGGDFWSSRNIEEKATRALSGSARVHGIVGDAVTVIQRPAGMKYIVLQIFSDSFYVKPGRHLGRSFSFFNINITLDTAGIFNHPYTAGDGPFRLTVEQAIMEDVDLTFDQVPAADDTLTRAVKSWVDDGFVVGMPITVSGSASNDAGSPYTILTLTETVLGFAGDVFVDEGPSGGISVVGPTPSPTDLPAGLDTTTDYFIGDVASNAVSFHLTHNDAKKDINRVNITDKGNGGMYTIGKMPSANPTATSTAGTDAALLATDAGKGGEYAAVIAAPTHLTLRGTAAGAKLAYWFLP